ncbi:flagellar hook-associated family protein [Mesorhizobium sp. CAU 1741]|uniref:flagellar hook-associated family protein n=1 Tax=Mesorhizobium sp. CAU 1741 TaxID=3140366 RepID=UPI00325A46FA
MKVSFVSTQAITQAMRYQMARMQTDLVSANKEAVTFRVADRGLALGARTGMSVSFHRDIDRLKGLTDSNELAASRLASTQVILNQMKDDADSLLSAFTTALSSASDPNIAKDQAEVFIASMTSSLNAHLNGEHLFAGINTDVKPLDDFLDPASTSATEFNELFEGHFGFYPDDTDVSDITAAEMEDFLDNVVEPYFMGTGWTDHWSSATDQQIVSRITLTETAETSVSANIDPFRKLAMAAATISVLVGRDLQSTTKSALLEKAISDLGAGISGIANQTGYTGITEQRIDRANERMSMQVDIISKSLIDIEGVDESEAAVKVNGLIAQIELSYTLTSRMQQMSLLKFL